MSDINVNRGRSLSLENAKPVGSGAASWVYELDDGNIVKVLKNGGVQDAEREILLAKWAFTRGIPTAISYDVVNVDGRPGLVYESFGRSNLRNAFRDHPERFDTLLADYLELLHNINSVTDDEGRLPDTLEQYRTMLDGIAELLTKDELGRLSAVLDSVPPARTVVHGDCQIKNVRVVGGKLYIIDLDTLSRGDPIFELAALFCCYRCYPALDGGEFNSFFDIPTAMLTRILDAVAQGYYAGLPAGEREANIRKAELLGWLCTLVYMHDDGEDTVCALEHLRRLLG